MTATGEFALIEFIRQRQVRQFPGVTLGIGDDAALLRVPSAAQLAVCTDTLNAGVHFPLSTAPAAIGWKSLAVNLSDLAAMGATPMACLLNLSLPEGDAAWLNEFLDGFLQLAEQHDVALIGGDTTRGPLSITVTALGHVPVERALRRDGARVGDEVWVSGQLGDAALALDAVLASANPHLPLRDRLDRPVPRVALGLALRGLARSAIDVSDGILQDLGHIAHASGVGMHIDANALPMSAVFKASVPPEKRLALQTAGDDYELAFTADPGARAAIASMAGVLGVPLTRIGVCVEGAGVCALRDGTDVTPAHAGHVHFK